MSTAQTVGPIRAGDVDSASRVAEDLNEETRLVTLDSNAKV